MVFLFLLGALLLLERTRSLSPKEHYAAMLNASQRTAYAFSALKEEKLSRGYALSPVDDPNGTGMIGESYTEITTTLGSLESKRSTTNPNVSAMVVDMLIQCGVKKGDRVAVNLSSSFPALNISILCALDSVGADGVITNSVGASTYGGNLPDFTYLDMEHVLLEQGIIVNHSCSFSLGGADDIGKEMPDEIKDSIVNRLRGYGLDFLFYEDMEENLAIRQSIYQDGGSPVCFINAGGNLLSFAGGTEMISAHNGILFPENQNAKSQSGLIPMFLEQNVPVIHLLNMKSLLPAYGLPFDPSPIPPVGDGGVYRYQKYQKPLAALLLAAALLLLFYGVRRHPKRKIPL